jgi:hypothetical protein
MAKLLRNASFALLVTVGFATSPGILSANEEDCECRETYYGYRMTWGHCSQNCSIQHAICNDWCGFYVPNLLQSPGFTCGVDACGTSGVCDCGENPQ